MRHRCILVLASLVCGLPANAQGPEIVAFLKASDQAEKAYSLLTAEYSFQRRDQNVDPEHPPMVFEAADGRVVSGMPHSWREQTLFRFVANGQTGSVVTSPLEDSPDYSMAFGTTEKLFFQLEERDTGYAPIQLDREGTNFRKLFEKSRLFASPFGWGRVDLHLPSLIREKRVKITKRKDSSGDFPVFDITCPCTKHADCPAYEGKPTEYCESAAGGIELSKEHGYLQARSWIRPSSTKYHHYSVISYTDDTFQRVHIPRDFISGWRLLPEGESFDLPPQIAGLAGADVSQTGPVPAIAVRRSGNGDPRFPPTDMEPGSLKPIVARTTWSEIGKSEMNGRYELVSWELTPPETVDVALSSFGLPDDLGSAVARERGGPRWFLWGGVALLVVCAAVVGVRRARA